MNAQPDKPETTYEYALESGSTDRACSRSTARVREAGPLWVLLEAGEP